MMAAAEIIAAKRSGARLGRGQFRMFAEGAAERNWTEPQLAALLMAIAVVGLDAEETGWLVEAMAATGRRVEAERFSRPAVDKHSTGGVGDKASLVVAPLAAACGLDVPMVSGRGLGHTGGTLDKLESIPGFRVDLSIDELVEAVAAAGCAICGAGEEIAPADAVLYPLRDATATVDSIPLICGSILSKKLAEGIGGLVLDVKCGTGAVFSGREEAELLARSLVASGTAAGLSTVAILTPMSSPLGRTVGNAIEVVEALECLGGGGPRDLRDLSVDLVARMLVAGGVSQSVADGMAVATRALDGGEGFERFERMVVAQGGNASVLEEADRLKGEAEVAVVRARRDGFVCSLDALTIGAAAAELAGSRRGRERPLDLSAGVSIVADVGSEVSEGDAVLELRARVGQRLEPGAVLARSAIEIRDEPGVPQDVVLATIDEDSLAEPMS